MFHHHHGLFAGQAGEQFGGALDFAVGHAGNGFVDEQQFGFLHQEHADFQPLLLAVREHTGRVLAGGGEADGVQHLIEQVVLFARKFAAFAEIGAKHAFAAGGGEREVVVNAERFKHGGGLEFAADAGAGDFGFVHFQEVVALAEPHIALVGAGFAGDDVHHG